MSHQSDFDEFTFMSRILKYWYLWLIGAMLIVSGIIFTCKRSVEAVETGIVRYQEFQEIHNTCLALNTQLCQIREIANDDKMFEQISKNQRIVALQAKLANWVENYNAKSKLINFSIWKSKTLPYELSVDNFKCY